TESELLEELQSTFGVAKPTDQQPTADAAKPRQAALGLNVLMAEDNQVNQRLATRLLEKRGHRVAVTSDGKEAVETYLTESFDVILMDVHMPKLNGLEATTRIREKE